MPLRASVGAVCSFCCMTEAACRWSHRVLQSLSFMRRSIEEVLVRCILRPRCFEVDVLGWDERMVGEDKFVLFLFLSPETFSCSSI